MKNDNIFRNIIIVLMFFLTFWFGIRPIITGEEFQRRVKKAEGPKGINQFSLVVFGTEPEGIAAALAGARLGLKTLLVTEDSDPGSYIRSGLVTYTSPDYAVVQGVKKKLNNGIYAELFGETGGNFTVSDYISSVKQIMEKEPQLTVLYDAGFLSAHIERNTVKGVNIYHNGEKRLIEAPVFIDATENGDVLSLCNVPFFTGSADISVPDCYMPVEFNFIISNVKWQDMESIRKLDKNKDDFQSVLKQYERYSPKTKISNLSFIGQPGDDMVISGIRMRQVNVDDPEKMREDFENALTESKLLTAYLKYAFVPFENCSFKTGPESFYIPEYRHFEGVYRLTVEDILENRDFPTKAVLASGPVDAEKFVSPELSEEYTYIIGNPRIYSIPLECFIAKNYCNLLMVGKKASFSSLAATSAGRLPVSVSSGEAIGVAAAYCYLNDLTPLQLSESSEDVIDDYHKLLKRSGVTLFDFDEPNPNSDHWAWPSVKVLAGYGLLAGGEDNDYLLDIEANQSTLRTLIINLIVKAVPEKYTLDLDSRLKSYDTDELLTGEKAFEILLKTLDIQFRQGNAYNTAREYGLVSKNVLDRMKPEQGVTLDYVYDLTVNLIDYLK
ncbi:MAG: FAD-dependent oxidoreductase [Clostridiaceae bacterium]|jgi:hypothetical protein|nr:FAD-dependent oxidoreductase [Clostridiaceae bacterium]